MFVIVCKSKNWLLLLLYCLFLFVTEWMDIDLSICLFVLCLLLVEFYLLVNASTLPICLFVYCTCYFYLSG